MRLNKRDRLDSIDIYDNIQTSSAKVMKLATDDTRKIESVKNIYWDSSEVVILSRPKSW